MFFRISINDMYFSLQILMLPQIITKKFLLLKKKFRKKKKRQLLKEGKKIIHENVFPSTQYYNWEVNSAVVFFLIAYNTICCYIRHRND